MRKLERGDPSSKYRIPRWRINQLKKYGITPEVYASLLKKQNNCCKICGSPRNDKSKEGYWSLSVDHDHKTGKVRGLLCGNCNRLLGYAQDNPVILLKSIQYLRGNL